MNSKTHFAPLRLGVRIFLLILALTGTLYSQTDLTNLEASVREQIATAQAALAAAKRSRTTTRTALSEKYGKLGQLYHAYALTSAARDCYLNANRLAPKEFRWIYLLGKLDHQEGRFDEAIRRYEAARTLRPGYVAVHVNLGNIFLELNRLEDARESFGAALELDKDNPAAHYGLGQLAMSKRSYREAADHFEKTLARVPSANRVHYSLAMAYRGLGDLEKVKAHLAQQGSVGVRVADPLVDSLRDLITGERVHLARGKVAFEAGRYAEAASEFSKAVASQPDSVVARINLGGALTQMGDLNGAAEQFEQALRIEPGRVTAHFNLAVLLARQNKHEQAITHLRSVLSVDENDHSARLLLSQQLKNSGRLDEALGEFSRLVQADPDHEDALLEQVKLLYRKGQFKQALASLEKAHLRYPYKWRTMVLLAYLLAASPEIQLRNGARALELTHRIYSASLEAQHGALSTLALAELNRCSDAADWQRRMVTAAEREGNTDLAEKLRSSLKLYENVVACRPDNETLLSDMLWKL